MGYARLLIWVFYHVSYRELCQWRFVVQYKHQLPPPTLDAVYSNPKDSFHGLCTTYIRITRYAIISKLHAMHHSYSFHIPPFPPKSLKIIPINLITHNHHPKQKHTPHNIKAKHRFPIITNPLRLQPRQRRPPLPTHIPTARGIDVAVGVHGTGGPVELDGCFD